MPVNETGKSEGRPVMGAERDSNVVPRARGLTSSMACNTPVGVTGRETGANLNRGRVDNGPPRVASGHGS